MSDHTVSAYDDELKELTGHVAEMGGLAERMLDRGVQALMRTDVVTARQVVEDDNKLDDLQRLIEELAVSLIARRQPMASDLREIVAALRISNDLERVGDLAKNIARRSLAIDGAPFNRRLGLGVEHLAELASHQIRKVLDAYTSQDVDLAMKVWQQDEEIDALYTSLFRELLTYMMEDPRKISLCTHLLFCAKNIERIGDHATNIAETVHYLVTGEQPDEERPKADNTAALATG